MAGWRADRSSKNLCFSRQASFVQTFGDAIVGLRLNAKEKNIFWIGVSWSTVVCVMRVGFAFLGQKSPF